MKWWTFFKPTWLKMLLFVVLVALFWLVLTNHQARISFFPCQTQPVIPNPPGYANDLCGLWMFSPGFVGVNTRLTAVGIVVIVLVLLVVPYLLACLVASRLKPGQKQAAGDSGKVADS